MKRNLRRGLIVAFAFAVCAALPATAQIYLQTDPPIDGGVTAPGYEGQIAVQSYQFGAGQGISCGATSDLSLSEVTITKQAGLDSIALAQALSSDTVFSSFTFRFTALFGGVRRDYQIVTLTNALLSGYSQSSGGDTPSESLSVSFSRMDITYFLYDQSGGKSIGSDTVSLIPSNCPGS